MAAKPEAPSAETEGTELPEVPTLELPLQNGKGETIDKHAAVLRFYAAEFMVPIMTGEITTLNHAALVKLSESVTKMKQEFDKRLLSLPEADRNGLVPFRQPRSDKSVKSVDEDIFG